MRFYNRRKFRKFFWGFPFPLIIIFGFIIFKNPLLILIPIGIIVIGAIIYFVFIRNGKRININIKKSVKETKKIMNNDVKSCEEILKKINHYIKSEKLGKEYKRIYIELQGELKNAKKLSKKINIISEILSDPGWDLNKINKLISIEENKDIKDAGRIEKLNEMKDHVIMLKDRLEGLKNEIENLKISFQTIYTKITLLSNTGDNNFDEIETEIQKILDHKLKVAEYEEKLNNELKEL